jgi:hypothetical protein
MPVKQFIIIATIFLCNQVCYGQPNRPISDTIKDKESYIAISDSLMKNEIAFFNIKGSSLKKADPLAQKQLTEITVSYCTDNEVHLSWSTFFGSMSTFISIYFKGEAPNRTLDSIFLVTHSHFWVKIPRDSYKGVSVSNSCNFSGGGKKGKFFSPYYKAFYSKDKRRLYIYMLCGTETNKYEVTWVFINNKYYTRIVDSIP